MTSGLRFKSLMNVTLWSAVVAAIFGGWQGTATAGPIEIATPTTLHGGDQFRFIFVTPNTVTTDATSSNISVYNTLVQNYANGFTYNGQSITASAIVSVVGGVDAITNVGVHNVAVYMASGTEVAVSDNGSTGLFSANDLLAQPVQDLSGNSFATGYVWTGTSGLGTQYNTNTNVGNVNWGLGGPSAPGVIDGGVDYSGHVEVGSLSSTSGYSWLSVGFGTGLQLNTQTYQIYGISDVLTVVPEPSTFLISGLGFSYWGLPKKAVSEIESRTAKTSCRCRVMNYFNSPDMLRV